MVVLFVAGFHNTFFFFKIPLPTLESSADDQKANEDTPLTAQISLSIRIGKSIGQKLVEYIKSHTKPSIPTGTINSS